MHRFLCQSKDVSKDSIEITDKEQVHHIASVLRLKENDKVTVFDEAGNEYETKIISIDKDSKAVFSIMEKKKRRSDQRIELTVACAIPKKSKIDDIIDKLTQLGVARIIPMVTERVIVKLDRQKARERKERWQKIALAASKQSQRNTVPVVDEPRDIVSVLSLSKDYDLKLVPTLFGQVSPIKKIASGNISGKVMILIGPEGDFTEAEVEAAQKCGFKAVSLGDLVLRVETAAVYATSVFKFLSED